MYDPTEPPPLLVFEGDVVRAHLLLATLAGGGIAAAHARELSDAVELVEERPPEVVVVSVGVRQPKGLELVRFLRERHPEANTRVLAVVVPDEEEFEARARDLGVDDFVFEPFLPIHLQERILQLARKAA